jgi:hypothetical protein
MHLNEIQRGKLKDIFFSSNVVNEIKRTVLICCEVKLRSRILHKSRPGSSVGIETEPPGWTVRDRIPVETRFSNCPDRPCDPPSLLYNKYRVFPGGKGGWSVGLPPHPHLVPKGPRKSRAIPLPNLRAFVVYKKGENLPIT